MCTCWYFIIMFSRQSLHHSIHYKYNNLLAVSGLIPRINDFWECLQSMYLLPMNGTLSTILVNYIHISSSDFPGNRVTAVCNTGTRITCQPRQDYHHEPIASDTCGAYVCSFDHVFTSHSELFPYWHRRSRTVVCGVLLATGIGRTWSIACLVWFAPRRARSNDAPEVVPSYQIHNYTIR